MKKDRILVIGACGRIGSWLTAALIKRYGSERVIAADLYPQVYGDLNYLQLDVLDHASLRRVIRQCEIGQVYLLATMSPGNDEKEAKAAWKLNMQSLLSVLELGREWPLERVFWPSSIAVFGPGAPRYNCGQLCLFEPNTIYGISKKAGENWCNYYFKNYGVDIRSIRYPGIVAHSVSPACGMTDFAVDIFHQAIERQQYTCYLKEDTCLPLLYMPDAVRAAMELMEAPLEKLTIRTSYNIAGMSFAPCDLAAAITGHIPGFRVNYEPDHRQAISEGWPVSIDDRAARLDWNWKPEYQLAQMTTDMILKLTREKGISPPDFACLPEVEFYPDNY